MQGQERTSSDGAESVVAKQETAQGAQRGAAETGSNQGAESVTARDGGSDDDSGTEEGEIAGVRVQSDACYSVLLLWVACAFLVCQT